MPRSVKRKEKKEKHPKSHQRLYTAVVVGDALHVGGVLPVGHALLVQAAAAQDQPCVRSAHRP